MCFGSGLEGEESIMAEKVQPLCGAASGSCLLEVRKQREKSADVKMAFFSPQFVQSATVVHMAHIQGHQGHGQR